ncbi:MAG TPA: hypothetical protein VLK33_01365, partial [Terriglobales bacterium]|nr:hypothetical protein [Terriglobales bacterium]
MNIKKMIWGQAALLLSCVLSCSMLQAQAASDASKSATDTQPAPAAQPAAQSQLVGQHIPALASFDDLKLVRIDSLQQVRKNALPVFAVDLQLAGGRP